MTTVASARTVKAKKKAAAASPRPLAPQPGREFSWKNIDRTTVPCALLLAAAVLACYSSVTHNGFVDLDDPAYITENPPVQAGLTWQTVKWAFTSTYEANWHPLTWMSHALDWQIFGANPAGPHWENALLHALNAVLLFLLLQYATGFRWRSLMVAALFALHPINVESVAWAAERKNVLSMLFFLLALYAYIWYTRQPAVGRYAAVAGFFTLSLMAKPQAVTFPFLLLLLDYWPLARFGDAADVPARRGKPSKSRFGFLVWEKVPLFALSAVSSIVTMIAQSAGGAVKDLSIFSLGLRMETALIAYARYLGKAFWPAKLAALYPHATKLYPVWQVAGAALLLLAITAACVRAREKKYLAVGWFWFLGSLVPMIGLVQVGAQAMADRYAYLSFIGLFVMVVWLVADAATALRFSSRWLAVPAGACLLVLAVLTYHQVSYWHDIESFWNRTLEITGDNYTAQDSLAAFLHNHGRDEEAVVHLRAVLAVRPDDLRANLYMGHYEATHGNLQAAVDRMLVPALHANKPKFRAQANGDLGFVYFKMGDLPNARHYMETSLQLLPNQPRFMVLLGLIAQRSGDLSEAVRQYARAAEREHTDVDQLLLVQALRLEGHNAQADAVFHRVAQSSQNLAAAQRAADALLAGR
jgi:tetratricopeptide (TPR) repeat protein